VGGKTQELSSHLIEVKTRGIHLKGEEREHHSLLAKKENLLARKGGGTSSTPAGGKRFFIFLRRGAGKGHKTPLYLSQKKEGSIFGLLPEECRNSKISPLRGRSTITGGKG